MLADFGEGVRGVLTADKDGPPDEVNRTAMTAAAGGRGSQHVIVVAIT